MTTWYKIDDPENPPPKDGTSILLWWPQGQIYTSSQAVHVAHWSLWGSGIWESSTSGHRYIGLSNEFTHWAPLPAAPATSKHPAG